MSIRSVWIYRQSSHQQRGFSSSNLWYMKKWYQFYAGSVENSKLQQVVGEIDDTKLSQLGREIKLPQDAGETKFQQAVGELSEGVPFPVTFALVPWGHHIEIMAKSKSIDEALFYIQHTISRGWSRSALMNRRTKQEQRPSWLGLCLARRRKSAA